MCCRQEKSRFDYKITNFDDIAKIWCHCLNFWESNLDHLRENFESNQPTNKHFIQIVVSMIHSLSGIA